MKPVQSNPLQQELRRGEAMEAHPYEDVLSAFAENSLLERERLMVVEHLSRCGKCREVLSLAAGAAPTASVSANVFVLRPRLRGWVPWAVAAAGVILVSSAAIVYERGVPPGGRSSGGAASVTRTEPTPSSGGQAPGGIARGSLPGTRASALASGGVSGLAAGSGVHAHWRISEGGQVERSMDGATWQMAMPDERTKMHVVWVSGSDVWVGGEGLRLYRSADEGGTWRRVELPVKEAGAHGITHIRFKSDGAGTVQADDGTWWSTADGGQSWK